MLQLFNSCHVLFNHLNKTQQAYIVSITAMQIFRASR